MNRLARPILGQSCRRVAYRQDMPPPGGYPAAPWRRNLPGRGFGYIGVVLTAAGYGYFWWSRAHHRYGQWRRELKLESENMDMACMPLYEAETDRDELRALKHQIESEAVNIVASGFDKTWKCGGYGIGDNGSAAYWPSHGFKSPYNLDVTQNSIGGDRWAKQFTPAHANMTMNNAMWMGYGKFEHVGPGTRGNNY